MLLSTAAMSMNTSEQEFEKQRQQYRDLLEQLQEKADSSGAHGVDPDVLRLLMLQGNELFVKGGPGDVGR